MADKNGISNEDKRAIAYDLYMNTDMNQKEICDRIKITQATFTTWKNKYDWEIHKQAFSITSQNIVANLMERAFNLSNEEKFNADAILKVVKAIESLSDKKITISHIINIFKDFINWEFDRDPELAKQINNSMKGYVDFKINGK